MILYKNRLVFGLIKKIVFTIFKAIYSVISLLNLQFTLLCALVGLILYLTGAFEKNPVYFVVFVVASVFSVLLAITLTFRRLFGLSGKKKGKKDKPQKQEKSQPDVEKRDLQDVEKAEIIPPAQIEENFAEERAGYPKYFSVKQNPDYVMAEYEDRYELYLKDRGGLKKIRTDYK